MPLSSASIPPPLPALIACVDSNEDVVLLLRDRLVEAGYRAVTFCSPVRYGPQPVVDFLTYLAPAAAVYTISPPYAAGWAEFAYLCREVPECPCLAATTHKAALERLVGPTDALEVLATADDLDVLVDAVRALLAAQPSEAPVTDGLMRPPGADGRGPDARERIAR